MKCRSPGTSRAAERQERSDIPFPSTEHTGMRLANPISSFEIPLASENSLKINTGMPLPAPRWNTSMPRGADATFASALSAASKATEQTAGVARADFSNMTRQQLRDWVNTEIRAGRMTLDESSPFVGMTIAIPVNGDTVAAERAISVDRVDFLALTRGGIDGARWRHDDQAAASLERALQIMQQYQGMPTGVDTIA
jgi:hypothetical protein